MLTQAQERTDSLVSLAVAHVDVVPGLVDPIRLVGGEEHFEGVGGQDRPALVLGPWTRVDYVSLEVHLALWQQLT